MILFSAITFTKSAPFLGSLNLVPCLGIALLLLVSTPKILTPIYHNPILSIIGKISYTWYLFHWPFIAIYKYLFEQNPTTLDSILLFFGTLLLSYLIYRFYEQPLRYFTPNFTVKRNLPLIASIASFIGVFGFLNHHINSNSGWLFRLGAEKLTLIKDIKNIKKYHENNWGGANYKFGLIGESQNNSKKIDMVWLGESHCGHYTFGLDSLLVKKHGKKIYMANMMNPSALFLPDVLPTHLNKNLVSGILNRTINVLKQNPNAVLVLSHYWAVQLNRSQAILTNNQTVRLSNSTNSFIVISQKINKLLQQVGNRKVILIGTGPIKSYDDKLNYVEKLLKPKYVADFIPNKSTFRPNVAYYAINEYFKNYVKDKSNFYYLDPREALCQNNVCMAQRGSKIFLSDWDHLSKEGSLHVIKFFEETLLGILND